MAQTVIDYDLADLPELGLGLTLWHGVYERKEDTSLRWCKADGALLLTGNERAESEAARAERLAAKLRELGIDPGLV